MDIYYIIFIVAIFIASFSIVSKKVSTILLIIVLTLFAGTRLNIDEDYQMYYKYFKYVEDSASKFFQRDLSVEFCMYVVPNLIKIFTFNKVSVIYGSFIVFAFLGVTTKLVAIKRYSYFFLLSVMLYVSNLFLMQEMTTIRAGVAAGILLLSLKDIETRNNKGFFIKLFLALLFHTTSVLILIPWILIRLNIRIVYFYFAIFVSFIFAITKVNIIKLLMLNKIFTRIDIYLEMMEWQKNEGTNIFSFRSIFALLVILIMAIRYKKLKDIKYFDVLFKIQIVSVCVFFMLSVSAEAFSIRSFELYSIFQILLYPMLIFSMNYKLRVFGWIIVILYSLLQIYYLVDVADIYKPYKSWFF